MNKRGPAGQTLVETVLVLALAGFLVQAGAFSWKQIVPKYRLQSAVWEVRTCLNEARFKAVWTGKAARARFVPGGYRLETYEEGAKSWRLLRAGLVEGAEIRANNSPTFYPQGTVANLATIIVSNVRGEYKITIAISGRIKAVKTR